MKARRGLRRDACAGSLTREWRACWADMTATCSYCGQNVPLQHPSKVNPSVVPGESAWDRVAMLQHRPDGLIYSRSEAEVR